jgi:hypothetical protein
MMLPLSVQVLVLRDKLRDLATHLVILWSCTAGVFSIAFIGTGRWPWQI